VCEREPVRERESQREREKEREKERKREREREKHINALSKYMHSTRTPIKMNTYIVGGGELRFF
jgi:hypothetical protein